MELGGQYHWNLHIREKSLQKTVFIVSKYEGDLPPYFIEYDNTTKTITNINKNTLLSSHTKDYFTDEEIKSIIRDFTKYNLFLIGVDEEDNIYLNPYYINSPPYYLRIKKRVPYKDSIRKGYLYIHLKENWYVNK